MPRSALATVPLHAASVIATGVLRGARHRASGAADVVALVAVLARASPGDAPRT